MYAELTKDLPKEVINENDENSVKGGKGLTPGSAAELRILFAQHIMMGVARFLRIDMHYKKSMCQTFFDKMTRKRFSELRTHLHLVNVEDKPAE